MTFRPNARGTRPWLAALLFSVFVASCGGGGGRDPILGFDTAPVPVVPAAPPNPPTVTAVAPVNGATGVAINNAVISANFSEAMQPLTGTSTFVVTCAAPCVSPTGTLAFDATRRIATFTRPAGASLAPLTQYTATITNGISAVTGLAMAQPYVWRFTTGIAPDTTRPRVVLTVPATTVPGPTPGVPANTAVSATFTEDMAPLSIHGGSFTLTCAAPCAAPPGTVTYVVGNRTAVFTPSAPLTAGTVYTATVTSAATDLAGNALAGNQAPLPAASNYIWTFTTAAPVPVANLSIQSSNPANGSTGVCPNDPINVTFTVPSGLRMDPTTINAANFTVTGPTGVQVLASSVRLDNTYGRIATFTPLVPLTVGLQYVARVRGGANGVKDLALPGNSLPTEFSMAFAVSSCSFGPVTPPPGVPPAGPALLGSASTFGIFGGSAGATNQGLLTVINGDIGTTAVSTAVTGFHDAGPACTYTETPLNVGTVNGLIYTSPPPPTVGCPTEGTAVTAAVAAQGRADALTAYNALVALPGGPDPGAGNLANLTLAPGTYTAGAGTFRIQGGDLTLDAQGNAGAVWVFQMATSLTVGGPGAAFPSNVILTNGADASNVYWQVGSAATINAGGGGTFVGTIISQAGVAVSTAGAAAVVTVNGRLLSLGAAVTVVNTVVNVP